MTNGQVMEDRLQALIGANRPENRAKWALEWKRSGKLIVGLVDHYVPEEVISAAGALPVRLTGTWEEDAPHAGIYRPEMTCRYCSHVLESLLTGELGYLDGFVCVQVDDDFKRLWDLVRYTGVLPKTHILYLPHSCSATTLGMWESSVQELRETLEAWTGQAVADEALTEQISVYNRTRALLRQVYELRRRAIPALTGAEALGLTTAARVMPKEIFNAELESLLPYLEARKGAFRDVATRILMLSEYLDNPAYVQMVEDCGCAVVMDEFDTGAKYFWEPVDLGGNPWKAVAKRYIDRPGTSRMEDWSSQIEQVKKWAREFDVQGVVELKQLFSLPLAYRFFIMKRELEEAGIPYISLDREYHLANQGMLTTRVEAFMEMIRQ